MREILLELEQLWDSVRDEERTPYVIAVRIQFLEDSIREELDEHCRHLLFDSRYRDILSYLNEVGE